MLFPSSGVLSFPLRPQLPVLLTPVNNSIAGSVLPTQRSCGGVSLHLGTTCFFLLPGCFPSLCDRSSPRNHLNFLSSGVLSFPLRPQLTSEPLVFSFFRGAFLPFATAAHLGTTCLFLLPGCFPSLCNRSSPRNDLFFPSSRVLSFPSRPQLTSELLEFSLFRGAFLPFATATHL